MGRLDERRADEEDEEVEVEDETVDESMATDGAVQ